jgi:linoleoyl-CoA desaturase
MYDIKFARPKDSFFQALQKEVNDYFKAKKIKPTGNINLYLKTLFFIPLALLLYFSLIFSFATGFAGIAFAGLLGFVLACIGFNVMHDACHGSYSSKKWVNELMGLSLNALGGNAFIWKVKHNVTHHTFTNVDGVDDDIAKMPFMRQCESQKRYSFHRFQHYFVFFFYAVSSFLWVFVMDFVKYFKQKILISELKMPVKEHIVFWASKVFYLIFYIALPISLVGAKYWAVGFAAMHVVMGLTLAIVFQLAHVVENVEFENIKEGSKTFESDWALHQLKTTADFAVENKIISWFVGGLNFQVEHHLVPRISHVHYPEINKILVRVCKEYNMPYHCNSGLLDALASHVRTMRALGKADTISTLPLRG